MPRGVSSTLDYMHVALSYYIGTGVLYQVGKIGQNIETIRKYLIANFSGVDFWTSPYANGTVDFMISPKEYTRVVRHLQHEKIPFKVNKNV